LGLTLPEKPKTWVPPQQQKEQGFVQKPEQVARQEQ